MELGFLILADHSEALNGKVYAMGGGWNMLRFAELPHQWRFGIAFGLDVPWDQTNHPHTLRLHIEGPDGERLGEEFSLDFETGRPAGTIPGQDQRMVLSLQTQLRFERAGPHAVVVRVGDEMVGRSRFYVQQTTAEPGAAEAPG